MDFRRSAGGRLALPAMKGDDFVPELNQVLESGLTDEAAGADREDPHGSLFMLMARPGMWRTRFVTSKFGVEKIREYLPPISNMRHDYRAPEAKS